MLSIGVNCFNPFQLEVMDVHMLYRQLHDRITFHGGLSTQKTLLYGDVAAVQSETQDLLEMGTDGGYIFAPAHDVEGDVPLENILAFIDVLHSQTEYLNITEERLNELID